jgi:hypothetical protein
MLRRGQKPMRETELRIRAYLGDPEAREALHGPNALDIHDLLKDGVLHFEPDFEKEAKDLVDALMRRVRHNVELILERLERSGYLFVETENYLSPRANDAAVIDAFEEETHLYVPLVLRAWTETVGSVNLMGTHPGWSMITYHGLGGSGHAAIADPLVVSWYPEYAITGWKEWKSMPKEFRKESFMLDFAPDPGHKAHYSSSGSYNLPATSVPTIDALVINDDDAIYQRTFLDYLRHSFKHGGFPGWSDYDNAPVESLNDLARGLDDL